MAILAVDLAAKFSAACLMDDDYQVLEQFDSWQITEEQFIYKLTSFWMFDEVTPHAMVVEDLPHGLSYTRLVKSVCRLQGRIVQAMFETIQGDETDIVFVSPATWRAYYPKAKRGTGSGISVPIAEGFGYHPPLDLMARAKGHGGLTTARKVSTDYCAAYLIARWATDALHMFRTLDVPGTSRYAQNPIRKKDFNAESSYARD